MQNAIPYTLVTSICTVNKIALPWWNRLLLWVFGGSVPENYTYVLTLKTDREIWLGSSVILENNESFYVMSKLKDYTVVCRSFNPHRIPLQFNPTGVLCVVSQMFSEGTRS